ncbi:Uncharacterized membrane protein YhaH, DUF805 family [Paraoerskovia marina]|uniref:Uncharacterized membrane protein YhaH, DUF805 family n=1 Tax=Paraoerskovia marina TaxID=545619 RepID=A0A1H1MNT5_9CELL|nr:DUF805 domain-containing protein [Paraoerskovia marina]SDR88418.1 Uncharacterized membrane protein YhaH, DUF805 family [Paraoerskovia marina]
MSLVESVKSVFSKYATFSGRARRSEYWWYSLVIFILSAIVGGIGNDILTFVFSLVILVPTLAVGVRRLHDTGRTGWWILIGLIPVIGTIVLIIFFVQDSESGSNQYGPSPKGAGAKTA